MADKERTQPRDQLYHSLTTKGKRIVSLSSSLATICRKKSVPPWQGLTSKL